MLSIFPKVTFYCPSNLDLPAKLREIGEETWIKKDLWRLYYVMTVIYRKRWETDFTKEEYVELNAVLLQRILHCKKAKPALDVLIRSGVIETDGIYWCASEGRQGRSRGYRFCAPFNKIKFRAVREINYSKISKHLLLGEENLKKLQPEHRYLYDCLKRVTILGEAKSCFQEDYNVCFMSDMEIDFYERSFEFINEQHWLFSVGETTGRVFTNITNLPREMRPYLRLDGRPLVEIDIRACQPLFLVQFYKDDEPEREKYLNAVLSGRFYELLDEKLVRPYGDDRRDDLKEAVFTQIFFDRVRSKKARLCAVFAEMFPLLYARIENYKTPKHAALSHKLQRDEVAIVIHGVVRDIAQNARFPVLTIHDSLLTFPECASAVAESLKDNLKRKTGITPQIKVKDYSKDPVQAGLLAEQLEKESCGQPAKPKSQVEDEQILELLDESRPDEGEEEEAA